MPRKAEDITGKRFGHYVAKEHLGLGNWRCVCDCGNERIIAITALKNGKRNMCSDCRAKRHSIIMATHGKSKSRLFPIWQSMLQRCYNERSHAYKDYGGRGISVCDEWKEFVKFEKWMFDNGYDENAERGKCSIDRIDVNGNYEPSNCRVISMREQACNKRTTVFLEFNGKRQSIAEWARELGMKHATIESRLHLGWSVEKTLTAPIMGNRA